MEHLTNQPIMAVDCLIIASCSVPVDLQNLAKLTCRFAVTYLIHSQISTIRHTDATHTIVIVSIVLLSTLLAGLYTNG
jgi:hypothetical protein